MLVLRSRRQAFDGAATIRCERRGFNMNDPFPIPPYVLAII